MPDRAYRKAIPLIGIVALMRGIAVYVNICGVGLFFFSPNDRLGLIPLHGIAVAAALVVFESVGESGSVASEREVV